MRKLGDFNADAAAAFRVGLKLSSEAMLEHKAHSLFVAFKPHFAEFMKELKGPQHA